MDGDCAAGLRCEQGQCATATAAPDDATPTGVVCGSPPQFCDTATQQCVDGACVARCDSGVRCGSDRLTCCGDGEVCLGRTSCVAPQGSCTDSFDCPADFFCEPTLGSCLPQFDPLLCQSQPVFAPFATTLEWSITDSSDKPACLQPISAPAVVDLDGDGLPEVVSNTACDNNWRQGVLRVFSGTGVPIWTATAAADELHGRASIAVGDLNGDGLNEIIAVGGPSDRRLFAFSHTGVRLWASKDSGDNPVTLYSGGDLNGGPAIVDLDQDGSPEIVYGAMAFDANGVLLWSKNNGALEGTNNGYNGGLSAIGDIDGDSLPEVISGRRVYDADGTAKMTLGSDDGYPALADFDGDGAAEIVLVAKGKVAYYDGATGALEWGPVSIPGGGRGGPPTVADFDGDGLPEIGVAGAGSYSVYDPDGAQDVLWSKTTQDNSSNATGSSVFDFEGDGIAEVVYGDECFMRVYRGSDGEILLQIPSTSATIHEYPLVVDVDADGNSEIIIVANNSGSGQVQSCINNNSNYTGSRKGIFVYGDANDKWVRTRQVWNQHAYNVTNVTSSGGIPPVPALNWQSDGLNNYRQNVQGEGVFNAPDLTVLSVDVSLIGCPSRAQLRANIANEGSLGVPAGVPVTFRLGPPTAPGPLLGTVDTTVALLPGATTTVELTVDLVGPPPFAFSATVDDDGSGVGAVLECNDDNNQGGIDGIDCDLLI
ncbi:MAG: FG-GAP-like repeat-containing protein [Polyangiales bacterium]